MNRYDVIRVRPVKLNWCIEILDEAVLDEALLDECPVTKVIGGRVMWPLVSNDESKNVAHKNLFWFSAKLPFVWKTFFLFFVDLGPIKSGLTQQKQIIIFVCSAYDTAVESKIV